MSEPSSSFSAVRETIEVLSDHELVRALADREPVVHGLDAIKDLIAQRVERERS